MVLSSKHHAIMVNHQEQFKTLFDQIINFQVQSEASTTTQFNQFNQSPKEGIEFLQEAIKISSDQMQLFVFQNHRNEVQELQALGEVSSEGINKIIGGLRKTAENN
jgi:hypothetical protein